MPAPAILSLHSHRRRKPWLAGEHGMPCGALLSYLSASVHAVLRSLWVSHGPQPLVLGWLELVLGLQHAVPGEERSSSGSSAQGKNTAVGTWLLQRVPQHIPTPGFVSELSMDSQVRNQEWGISSQRLLKAALLTASFSTAWKLCCHEQQTQLRAEFSNSPEGFCAPFIAGADLLIPETPQHPRSKHVPHGSRGLSSLNAQTLSGSPFFPVNCRLQMNSYGEHSESRVGALAAFSHPLFCSICQEV